jgi:hypothetical protein
MKSSRLGRFVCGSVFRLRLPTGPEAPGKKITVTMLSFRPPTSTLPEATFGAKHTEGAQVTPCAVRVEGRTEDFDHNQTLQHSAIV